MLVSIVIPCYNSEKTIGEVVELCMDTFNKIENYECEIKGINLAKNFGQHAAIMAGLHYVNGDLVVGMDDDMQNHPSQIVEFLKKIEEGYDIVFGVFKERKFSWFKNLTGAVSRFFLWHLVERPKGIQMSSFWITRRYVIEQVKQYEGEQVFIQILFFRTTHNIANIEIEHFEREAGTSNYNFRKGLKLFLSFMNYSALPLRIATILGVLFSGCGLVSALVLLIQKLLDPDIVMGWSSIMCAMLIFFGILFLIVGIMGEYIGKIILNVNKMPQYVIRDTANIEKHTKNSP